MARRWSGPCGDGARPKERQRADGRRTRPSRGGVRPAEQPGRRPLRRLSRHAHRRELAAGPWRGGVSALASLPTCSISSGSFRRSTPSVALPYWRFDRPAPNLFTLEFLGVVRSARHRPVQRDANPLQFWRTDGVQGINRRPFFNTASAPPNLRNEAQTLALGTQYRRSGKWRAIRTDRRIPASAVHLEHPHGREVSAVFCSTARSITRGEVAAQFGRFDPRWPPPMTEPGNPIGHNLQQRPSPRSRRRRRTPGPGRPLPPGAARARAGAG